MKSRVSIIIPTYNSKKYLSDSINSCLNQTYSNIEVIIIDDGSNDGTRELIEENFSKYENIKYYYQRNKGRSAARNKGLDLANGDYIQFLDSDDYILPQKIQKEVDVLDKDKSVMGVLSNTIYIKENMNRPVFYRREKVSGQIYRKLIRGNFIPIHSVLFRKNQIKFNEKMSHCEDWDFWLRLCKISDNFNYVDDDLCVVRIHDGNTMKNSYKMLQGEKSVLLNLEKYGEFLNIIYYKLFENNYLSNNKEWHHYFKLCTKEDKSMYFKCGYFLLKQNIKKIFEINRDIYR